MNRPLGLLALLVTLSSFSFSQTPTPPPYCHPCLFYGGDFDANNPLSGLVENGDTLIEDNVIVEIPFRVPTGQTWTITGLFSNSFAPNPPFLESLNWTIRQGVKSGKGGKLLASGTTTDVTMGATGRSFNGIPEYTTRGLLTPATVVLTTGVYWMTAVPVCNNNSSDQCGGVSFYVGSVEDNPPPNAVGVEGFDNSFLLWTNSNIFFEPLAGATGYCSTTGFSCDRFSAGLIGTRTGE